MPNPFALSPLDALSSGTLLRSVTEYRKFLTQLGQFSDSKEIQGIRVQVLDAIAELLKETEKRK